MNVYFIQCGKKGPVKIGLANDPDKRMKDLQTANPYELKLITVINCESRARAEHLEKKMHRKFRFARIRGEWFKPLILKRMYQLNDSIKDGPHLADEIDKDFLSHWQSL